MRSYYVVKLIVKHGMTKTATFDNGKEARSYHARLRRIHGDEAVPDIEYVPASGRDGPRVKG